MSSRNRQEHFTITIVVDIKASASDVVVSEPLLLFAPVPKLMIFISGVKLRCTFHGCTAELQGPQQLKHFWRSVPIYLVQHVKLLYAFVQYTQYRYLGDHVQSGFKKMHLTWKIICAETRSVVLGVTDFKTSSQ